MTKIEQIASYVLNVPFDLIHIERPRTSVIPNPTSSGASTGTAYNGEAVKQVCEQMRSRLADFGQRMLKDNGEDWCRKQGIDYWNHGKDGWAAKVNGRLIWQNLVQLAYQQRVSLVVSFTAPIHGGEDPIPALTFKKGGQPGLPGIKVDPHAAPAAASTPSPASPTPPPARSWRSTSSPARRRSSAPTWCTTSAGASTRRSTSARSRAPSCRASATC